MSAVVDPRVNRAWIAAVVAGVANLAVSLYVLATDDNPLMIDGVLGLIHAGLVFFLAYWVRRNSRVAISLLIAYLIITKFDQYWTTGKIGVLIGFVVFGYFFAMGAVAIFEHHKERSIEA